MFDPYHKWLGIAPKDQPANHYRLLGLEAFESDLDVIEGAADRQMSYIRQYQSGEHAAAAARILNELANARLCLLKPATKAAYDAKLRESRAASEPGSEPSPFTLDLPSETNSAQKPPKRSATSKSTKVPLAIVVASGLGVVVTGIIAVVFFG